MFKWQWLLTSLELTDSCSNTFRENISIMIFLNLCSWFWLYFFDLYLFLWSCGWTFNLCMRHSSDLSWYFRCSFLWSMILSSLLLLFRKLVVLLLLLGLDSHLFWWLNLLWGKCNNMLFFLIRSVVTNQVFDHIRSSNCFLNLEIEIIIFLLLLNFSIFIFL